MALPPHQIERHRRHLLLKEIGGPGVKKLRAASVTIVGCGALGGPAALYLAAAGVGRLTLVDDDRVERSNLQRQVQFADRDIGAPKAATLAERCRAIDPGLEVEAHGTRFAAGMALPGDILIDATDNFPARHALNRLAHQSGRVLVSGAAERWQGQVSVYASGVVPGAPCLACLMPDLPDAGGHCDTEGVVGAVTGMVGALMALEAVKQITGAGRPLIGRLLLLDGLAGTTRTVAFRQDPACQVCSV